MFAAVPRTTLVTVYVSDPQRVEVVLPPATYVKLGKGLDVETESNT